MKKDRKPRYTADGLPTDGRCWSVEDWASLWRSYQQMVKEISERHRPEREKEAVINKLKSTRCTAGQAKVLSKFGYDPEKINVEQASAIIDSIKSNGWKRPQ